jgi:hypothetical protein
VLADRDHPGGLVVVAAGDDALRIGNDRPVVQENVDVILRGQQCADVALEHEVRLYPPLDGLDNLRVRGVHKVADLPTDVLLPGRERIDVLIDPRVLLICHPASP